jgi:hypothetical protein
MPGDDTTPKFRKGERAFFGYGAQRKYSNDTVKLGILRENNLMDMVI